MEVQCRSALGLNKTRGGRGLEANTVGRCVCVCVCVCVVWGGWVRVGVCVCAGWGGVVWEGKI